MSRRRAVSVGEVEPTRELVEAQGGLFKSVRKAWDSLENGTVTEHARRLMRFCLVGGSGVVVNTVLLYLLADAGGMNPLVAAVFSTEAAIINNFLLNDRWTFADMRQGATWLRRAVRYNSVALVGLVISIAVLAGLTQAFNFHYLIANLFAICAGTLWNYAGGSCFAWSTSSVGFTTIGRVLTASLKRGRRLVASVIAGVNE